MQTWKYIKNHHHAINQYLVREQVIDSLRRFFKSRGFHEVETPLLVRSPGTEPYLEVFETQLNFAEGDSHQAFLLTSPEYAMKKLLAAGFGDIFQICKSFRNGEGRSSRHNPEFTILEYYRVNADYTALMSDMEQIFRTLALDIKGQDDGFKYQGIEINLSQPFIRMSVSKAFDKFAGIPDHTLVDESDLVLVAKQKGYAISEDHSWEQAFNLIFLNEIEPKLDKSRPTIIYDYPVSQAALSRRKADDPRFAERFELYVAGLEIGNAFSELTDATEQEARLKQELEMRKKLGKTQYQLDDQFIEALKSGMPDCAGIAIGVDRLVMLFADVTDISDTLLFPVSDLFPEIA